MHASSGDYGSVGRVSEGITDRLDLTGYINGYRQNLAERIVLQHPKNRLDASFDASNTKGWQYAEFIQRNGTERKGLIAVFEIVQCPGLLAR